MPSCAKKRKAAKKKKGLQVKGHANPHNFILMVIRNGVGVKTCNLLIHQRNTMYTAKLFLSITNHEPQHFPSCNFNKPCAQSSKISKKRASNGIDASLKERKKQKSPQHINFFSFPIAGTSVGHRTN
ncbi:hypothetical protein DM860_016563 [Cuscuta australis]|uniref:Uncharacterized protein n=1 Tax=Cuscuta australis TaxID=267555 RepID=A0A328DRF4_9ASTE|nr:hypothetical protein DM860_016563 [Cuscuta australis]